MNHNRKTPDRSLRRDGRWAALQRLEEAIERNPGTYDNTEKIRLLRMALFGDEEEPEETEPPVLSP